MVLINQEAPSPLTREQIGRCGVGVYLTIRFLPGSTRRAMQKQEQVFSMGIRCELKRGKDETVILHGSARLRMFFSVRMQCNSALYII